MLKMSGYKCFNKGLINRYGKKFEVGVMYHCDNELKFGNNGHGFHMCQNLEDTLRYFDAIDEEVDICKVTCYGKTVLHEDEYNGFYNMYTTENIVIEKILSREEVIEYALKLPSYRVKRFIMLYRLNDEEKELFKEKFKNHLDVIEYIAYYQESDKEVFKRRIKQK